MYCYLDTQWWGVYLPWTATCQMFMCRVSRLSNMVPSDRLVWRIDFEDSQSVASVTQQYTIATFDQEGQILWDERSWQLACGCLRLRRAYKLRLNFTLALRRTVVSGRIVSKISFFAIKLSTREHSANFQVDSILCSISHQTVHNILSQWWQSPEVISVEL